MGHILRHWAALLILGAHLALGVFYSLIIPIWEAPDEWGHYPYVSYIAAHRSLPPTNLSLSERDDESKLQPPLYYVLAASAVFWVDTSDNLQPIVNDWAFSGSGEAGRNITLHGANEGFPYEGTVLAIHLARLVSVLLGTLAVALTYLMARLVFPDSKGVALGALAVHAFMPQLLFMGAVINNDVAVTAFSSLALYFLLRVTLIGTSWGNAFGAALAIAAALLSKLNAVALIPLMGLALGLAWMVRWRRGGVRADLSRGLLVFLGTGILFLWWLSARGQFLGWMVASPESSLHRFLFQFGSEPLDLVQGLRWEGLPEYVSKPFVTFWLAFGWGDVRAEDGVYLFLALVTAAALVGCLLFLTRRGHLPASRVGLGLVLSHLALSLGLVLLLSLYAGWAMGGRYLLPASSALSLALAVGVREVLPARWRVAAPAALGVSMFLFGVIAPFRYIMPTYAPPPLLAQDRESEVPNRSQIAFGQDLELVGYDAKDDEEGLVATLYWKPLHKMEDDYVLALKVVDDDGQVWAELHSYPGRGNYPTSLWNPGSIIVDRYRLSYAALPAHPKAARLYVAFFSYPEKEYLPVFDGQGRSLGEAATFGLLRIPGQEEEAPPSGEGQRYKLGEVVTLLGHRLEATMARPGQTLALDLFWQALGDLDEDYHVFVHLSDDERIWAQEDGPPRQGLYPTSLWQAGEVVKDSYRLQLPPFLPLGAYRLWVGMYNAENGVRLPIQDDEGGLQPGGRLLLGKIEVGG